MSSREAEICLLRAHGSCWLLYISPLSVAICVILTLIVHSTLFKPSAALAQVTRALQAAWPL